VFLKLFFFGGRRLCLKLNSELFVLDESVFVNAFAIEFRLKQSLASDVKIWCGERGEHSIIIT